MFFLSKTHLGKAKAETLKSRWGCDHYIIHESDGRSGKLLLLWRKEVVIQLNDVSKHFIDVVVRDGDEWRLTGVYGEPSWDHKDQTWGRCARYMVAVRSPGWPWVILTRFYFIMRRKGRACPQGHIQAFQDALANYGLADIGYTGDIFT